MTRLLAQLRRLRHRIVAICHSICDTLLPLVAAWGASYLSRLTSLNAEVFELCICFAISLWAAGCAVAQARQGAQSAAAAAAPHQQATGDATAAASAAPAPSMPQSPPAAQSQTLDGEGTTGY